MQAKLFHRAWTLDVIPPGKTKGVRYGNAGANVTALHLTFDVERTLSSNANKGKFSLTNLNPDTRNNLAPGSTVILRAGYTNALGIVFQGFIKSVASQQSNQDVVTSLDCGDGEPYITYGHTHLVYSETVHLAQVLQDIAGQLHVELGGQAFAPVGQIVQGIPNVTYARRTFDGKTKKVLDDLLKPLGILWSIQCGTLIIQNQKGRLNLRAEVVAPSTGLIGSPSRTATGVTFQALLNPRLVPGAAVQVRSANAAVNGNLRAIKCVYKGDSEGGDWTVTVDGQPLIGPLAPVPVTQKKDGYKDAIDFNDADDPEEVE